MKKRNFLYLLLLLNQAAEARQFQKALDLKKIAKKTDGNVEEIKREMSTIPTFNFPVGCSIYNPYHQTTWLGAAENIEGDEAEYSISCARHQTIEGQRGQYEAALVINPRAVKKAHLFSNKKDQPHLLNTDNPLHGKACKIMEEYNTNPLIVLKDSPSDLYYFSEILLDKNGDVTDVISITCFSFDKDQTIHHVATHQNNVYVFHSKNQLSLGDDLQVTVLNISLDPVEIIDGKKEKIEDGKPVKDENDQPVMEDNKKHFARHEIVAIASKKIDRSDIAFTGVDENFKVTLGLKIKTVELDNKLFAAFSIAAPTNRSVCGIVQLAAQLKPEPIKPESKKEDEKSEKDAPTDKKTVSALSQKNKTTEKNDVKEELAVNGGDLFKHEVIIKTIVPEGAERSRLPFCATYGNSVEPKKLTTLYSSTAANYLIFVTGNRVTAIPLDKDGVAVLEGRTDDFYSGGHFIQRNYKKGVGNSLLSSLELPYEIESLQVVGDTIYVQDKFRPGTYSYRALFNEDGSIGDWCDAEWIDSSGDGENIRLISGQKAYSWYGVCGSSSYSFNQTTWEKTTQSMSEFVEAVNQSLPQNISGVQGFASFFCNKFYEQRDLIVATGYNHAVYGYVTGKHVRVVDPQVVTIPEAGALVTAEIVGSFKERQEWLLLGGVGGLYGYASNDGSGFGVVDGIDDIFTAERSWKKIGKFSFVRKIVKDKKHDDMVYVVTSKGIYKVTIDKAMFSHPNIQTIFDSSVLGGRFDYTSDIFVDEEFAIIGTSKGLYVIDDMNNATQPYKLELDGKVGAVVDITALKKSKLFDNLYVLSNHQHSQTSSVHRVVVRNKKCTLFPDCTRQYSSSSEGVRGAFLSMDSTCSAFFSNGSWNVKMNYPYKNEQKAIMCYNSHTRSGIDTIRTANRNNLNSMYLSCVEGSQNIAGMAHNRALGCWILFGDFGLRILS